MRLYLYPMLLHDVHRDSTLALPFTDNFVSARTAAVHQIAPVYVCVYIYIYTVYMKLSTVLS